jgi:hypothetical protein
MNRSNIGAVFFYGLVTENFHAEFAETEKKKKLLLIAKESGELAFGNLKGRRRRLSAV